MPITVVVPAFNESAVIARCLERLQKQGPSVAEIIVVNNRSTDNTDEIVQRIANADPRVHIVEESKPGLIPARNNGFDKASHEVVARIDADTAVEDGWGAAIEDAFGEAGGGFAAATGPFHPYDLPFQNIEKNLHPLVVRTTQTKHSTQRQTKNLFGANMAITKSAWRKIRNNVLDRPGIWEDVDLSLALAEANLRIAYVPGMRAQVSGRRLLTSPTAYWRYSAGAVNTIRARGQSGDLKSAYARMWLRRLLYVAHYVPVRTWDPERERFSLQRLLSDHSDRIIP